MNLIPDGFTAMERVEKTPSEIVEACKIPCDWSIDCYEGQCILNFPNLWKYEAPGFVQIFGKTYSL